MTAPESSAPANVPYVRTMTFDVASVRETRADKNGGFTVGGRFTSRTTHLRMTMSIDVLLIRAYGVNHYQLTALPKWPYPALFVIDAKGDSAADARIAALPAEEQNLEQQHMLQALLEERFKLMTHWERREGDTSGDGGRDAAVGRAVEGLRQPAGAGAAPSCT